MGHLGSLRQEYRGLVHRLDAGTAPLPEPDDPAAWQGWKEILEILFTPEEAALASTLPVLPSSLERIAARSGVKPEILKPRLDAMADKGLVMDLVSKRTGKTTYLLSPPVVGFFEFSMIRAHDSIPKKRMAEALEAYMHDDESFARGVFGHGTVLGRALAHETAIGGVPAPDVLDWERATRVIDTATEIAVSLCYCRHKAEHLGTSCGAPLESCLSLNGGAEFVLRRGFGKRIDKERAMAILVDARERGLVQIADNVRDRPSYLCNCCGCCCGQLQSINQYGFKAVNPSGFIAANHPESCVGCSRCARACPIAAIAMVPSRSAKPGRKNDMRPQVDEESCIGCGVCADACNKDGMRMERRAKQPLVPANVIDKALRIALERGKLADLLFDEGESRGHRVLNHMIKGLTGLPAAQRVLASEQVKSRFVKAVLARVRDPAAA
ncbi:MAG: 4Fe-4S dicluster domain-containing protein [Myxococcales bacterium]